MSGSDRMKNSFITAARLARDAHAGQLDKAGVPYFLHVMRVGLAGETLEEQIVGVLHDTLEDTTVTMGGLRLLFTEDIVQAVVDLTRKRGEFYHAYIERVKNNPLARRVKINDLRDNLSRLEHLSFEERRRLFRRYSQALRQLELRK